MKKKTVSVLCAISFHLFALFSTAVGCTIWAATGSEVNGKGSLIGKNRDNLAYLKTTLRAVFPEKGFGFYGLFDTEADGYVTAGINEKGLVVVNAAANSVPREERLVATEDFTYRLLTSFDSIDSVMLQQSIFEKSYPAIYILADSSKIMAIEIAPAGRYILTTRQTGTLQFTNHYTSPDMVCENKVANNGSAQRFERIQMLMSRRMTPFCLDDFVIISNDTTGGTNGSLWRAASGRESVRTLAGWVAYVPPDGDPSVYVKIANESEPEKSRVLKIDQAFWGQEKMGLNRN